MGSLGGASTETRSGEGQGRGADARTSHRQGRVRPAEAYKVWVAVCFYRVQKEIYF